MRIAFETTACTYCNGNGVAGNRHTCMKCRGRKVVPTRRGLKARTAWTEALKAETRIPVSRVQVGQTVQFGDLDKPFQVARIEIDPRQAGWRRLAPAAGEACGYRDADLIFLIDAGQREDIMRRIAKAHPGATLAE